MVHFRPSASNNPMGWPIALAVRVASRLGRGPGFLGRRPVKEEDCGQADGHERAEGPARVTDEPSTGKLGDQVANRLVTFLVVKDRPSGIEDALAAVDPVFQVDHLLAELFDLVARGFELCEFLLVGVVLAV